jgi:outer membrane protein
LAGAELKVRQSVQSSWLGLKSGMAKVDALRLGLFAAESKLSSTQLAQEVGDRTTLDLLGATNEEMLAKSNLLQAKIDYLLNQLNMFALVGQLDLETLTSINEQLKKQ